MTLRALSFAFACLGHQASALSCVEPSIARSYVEAQSAEATYMIALGRFAFPDGALAPVPVSPGEGVERAVAATFEGHLFSGRGFDFETKLDVEITARCFGPWCGSFVPDVEVIAFLEERESGFALSITPCGGGAFSGPTKAQIAQIVSCHKGRACEPPNDW